MTEIEKSNRGIAAGIGRKLDAKALDIILTGLEHLSEHYAQLVIYRPAGANHTSRIAALSQGRKVETMATIRKEITVKATVEQVWDVMRDIGALHTRLPLFGDVPSRQWSALESSQGISPR